MLPAATQGVPQAIQVADRFHITKNLSDAVQQLLARVLPQMKEACQAEETQRTNERDLTPHGVPIEQWRPAPGKDTEQIVATRRAEREARYQQVVTLREQGLTSKQIADRLMMHERTVRHWLKRQVAPDVRQRRKYASDFDPYAPFVLKRWQQGSHNGLQLWREIVATSDILGPIAWSTAFWKRSRPSRCPRLQFCIHYRCLALSMSP